MYVQNSSEDYFEQNQPYYGRLSYRKAIWIQKGEGKFRREKGKSCGILPLDVIGDRAIENEEELYAYYIDYANVFERLNHIKLTEVLTTVRIPNCEKEADGGTLLESQREDSIIGQQMTSKYNEEQDKDLHLPPCLIYDVKISALK